MTYTATERKLLKHIVHSWLISFRSFIFIHFCLIPLGLASQGKRSASLFSNCNLVLHISGQAKSILLPLEASLASDLADAFLHENSSNNRIGSRSLFVHGKALYQSYNFKVREACQAWAPLVPSLTLHATHLHSMLIKLGHTSSLHMQGPSPLRKGSWSTLSWPSTTSPNGSRLNPRQQSPRQRWSRV